MAYVIGGIFESIGSKVEYVQVDCASSLRGDS